MATDKETLREALGAYGFTFITGPATVDGEFIAIKTVTDTATYSATSIVGDDLASVTMPSADIMNGSFSQIVVTTGSVLGYYDVG